MEVPDGLARRLAAYRNKLSGALSDVGTLSAPRPLYIGDAQVGETVIGRQLARAAALAAPTGRGAAAGSPGVRQREAAVPQERIYKSLVEGRPCVVLARGGAGKSVLLESFARAMAASVRTDDPPAGDAKVPLLVQLRQFNATAPERLSVASLLEGAEAALFQGSPGPILGPDDVRWLALTGALVPLFDGFDEFAHRSAFCHLLRAARSPGALLHRCAFAVASRPDADAWGLPVDRDGYRTLEPLARAEIRSYITVTRGLPIDHLDRAPDVVRRLLADPLHLCLWCNSIAATGTEPASLGDLMLELFANHMERRGHVPSVDACRRGEATLLDRERQLASLHAAYAKVCYRAGSAGFGRRIAIADLAMADDELRPILDVGRPAGIAEIVVVGGRVELYVSRVPVVEHLFAWEMARCLGAGAAPEERGRAIDLFRRWVWRPPTRDAFDHLFDRLWNAGRADLERAARGLVEWLANVSRSDCLWVAPVNREPTLGEFGQDDLCSTFSLAALRWVSLSRSMMPGDPTLKLIAAEVLRQSSAVPLWALGNAPELAGRPTANAAVLVELCCTQLSVRPASEFRDGLIRAVQTCMGGQGVGAVAASIVQRILDGAATAPPGAFTAEVAAIMVFAIGELPENMLFPTFRTLLDAIGDEAYGDGRAHLALPLSEVSERLPETHAEDAVNAAATAALDRGKYGDVRGMHETFRLAASRIPEARAVECLRTWWAEVHGRLAPIFADFSMAIGGAAYRLAPAAADELVERWVAGGGADDLKATRWLRGWVVFSMAARMSGQMAWTRFQEWLARTRDTDMLDGREVYLKAVLGACANLPESNAAEAIGLLLAALRDEVEPANRKEYASAIEAAATRVAEGASVECLGMIARASEEAALSDVRDKLHQACDEAATRVPDESRAAAAQWVLATNHGLVPALRVVRGAPSLALVSGVGPVKDGAWGVGFLLWKRDSLALPYEFCGVPHDVRAMLRVPEAVTATGVTAGAETSVRQDDAPSREIGPAMTWKIVIDAISEAFPALAAQFKRSVGERSAKSANLDRVHEVVMARHPRAIVETELEKHRKVDERRFRAALEDPETLRAILNAVVRETAGAEDEPQRHFYYVCFDCGQYNDQRKSKSGRLGPPTKCEGHGQKPSNWSKRVAHPTQTGAKATRCQECQFTFAADPPAGGKWTDLKRRGNQCPKCLRILPRA